MLDRLPGQTVSATAFVRNFGAYARTAGQHPIHILNHGRPAWSLVATDYLASLARSGSTDDGDAGQVLDSFLETSSALIIITDSDLRISRLNLVARQIFGASLENILHAPLAELVRDVMLLFQAAERVLVSGVPEVLDMDTTALPSRSFRIRAERFGDGVGLFGDETTPQMIAREKHAQASAYEHLIDTLPGLARGSINGRGLVATATEALSNLVNSAPDRIIGMRLASLFHSSSRSEVGDAIEDLLAERKEVTICASLQGDGQEAIPVVLTAIPSPTQSRDERGIFLISQRPS